MLVIVFIGVSLRVNFLINLFLKILLIWKTIKFLPLTSIIYQLLIIINILVFVSSILL